MSITESMKYKLQRALKEGGGTHNLQDILEAIFQGKMQSFVVGDSWAVTQVLDFPRRRVLEIFMAVGRLEDMTELEHKIEDFAVAEKITLMRTFGRRGFLKTGKDHGWAPRQTVFIKEIA